jgi:putative ABC transport system substrate-binding protein
MKRREFISLLGGAAAAPPLLWPLAARAQQPRPIRTIGVFSGMANEGRGQIYVKTLKERLEALGWMDGRNARIEYRWAAGDPRKIRTQAAEMVESRPDVIVAITTPAVAALRQETRDIPLVFANMSDPVDGGYVQSMARPGGNITGFTGFEYSIGGKWVELLKEAVPSLTRILVLHNQDNYTSRALLGTVVASAPTVGLQVTSGPVRSPAEIETAIVAFAKEGDGGMLLLPDPVIQANQQMITELAAKYRLPSLHQSREFPSNGGMMSYGTDFLDVYRRVADYVDRIL